MWVNSLRECLAHHDGGSQRQACEAGSIYSQEAEGELPALSLLPPHNLGQNHSHELVTPTFRVCLPS